MELLNTKTIAFLVGLISASFGAGITFSLWASAHPSRTEIAESLQCGTSLDACPAAKDAKEARRDVLALQNDVRALRRDLARGFGRCLSEPISFRDSGGKIALRFFQSEIAQGVPAEDAFRRVTEENYGP